MRTRVLVFLVSLFAVAACAPTVHWENKSVAREKWAVDQAACKRFAASEAEREYAKQSTLSGRDYTGAEGASHAARMAAYEARKFETRVFEQCMKNKGYSKMKGAQQ